MGDYGSGWLRKWVVTEVGVTEVDGYGVGGYGSGRLRKWAVTEVGGYGSGGSVWLRKWP